jgi:hypothetical protein
MKEGAMSVQRLGKRLTRLKAPADAGQGYDPVLADQWNDAAGARMFELCCRQEKEGLTDDERVEYERLIACSKAWRRRHTPPSELANLDPTITDADRARAWKLRLQPFRWDEPPLTEEERRELAALDARLAAERNAIAAAESGRTPGTRPKRARQTERQLHLLTVRPGPRRIGTRLAGRGPNPRADGWPHQVFSGPYR